MELYLYYKVETYMHLPILIASKHMPILVWPQFKLKSQTVQIFMKSESLDLH